MSITNSNQTAGRKAGAASNADFESIAHCSAGAMWDRFTDTELVRAVELMVSPSDLAIRDAALAVLKAFDYTPSEVREQLASGQYFNDGPVFDGLATDTPHILYPRK